MKKLTIIALALCLVVFAANAQKAKYEVHKPCSFSIALPETMELEKMEEETSPDFCDYLVKLEDENIQISCHSLVLGRYDRSTAIKDMYEAALKSSTLDISYKAQKSNWFVLSGIDKETGNLVYWKQVSGENFISTLLIEYPKASAPEIEKQISKISKSFKGD